MKCTDFRMAWLEGQVDKTPVPSEIKAHFSRCISCQNWAAEAGMVIRRLEEERNAYRRWHDFSSVHRPEKRGFNGFSPVIRVASFVIGAILVFGGLVFLSNDRNKPSPNVNPLSSSMSLSMSFKRPPLPSVIPQRFHTPVFPMSLTEVGVRIERIRHKFRRPRPVLPPGLTDV